MQSPAEERYVRRAQAGDAQAFAALVELHLPRIYRWLLGNCRHVETAEDLTQEVFLKAWAAVQSFQAGTNFKAWLFRIAHNCLVDTQRGPRGTPTRSLPDNLTARDLQPLARALVTENQRLLAAAVAALPDDFRAAFLLRAQEEMSFRDIAQALDLTEETARWRVFKARQLLLEKLGSQLDRNRDEV